MTHQTKNRPSRRRTITLLAAAAAAGAAAHLGELGARAGETGNAVTVSLSGSTAMRNFTVSNGFSLLEPGTSIVLDAGPNDAPVTYRAATNSTGVQLAALDAATATPNPAPADPAVTSANYLGYRIEWHEQGSVEGILELADGQINDGLLGNTIYNPTTGLATYVNRNKFAGPSPSGPNPPATLGGHFLDVYANDTSRPAGAQSRVQMAISDVNARQAFSVAGTPAFSRGAATAGFGKGNPALLGTGSNLGAAGGRHQLFDQSSLNMTTTTVDPGTGANYAAGAWNEGGVGNFRNNTVAITATLLVANPGTGLERLNRTDAQFLQATGRLANGADFNVATRDVGSGTLNVAALNTGLDPSFASGENDAGNGNSATGGTAQVAIGPGITFSNKTSGGSQLRPTVQNARMSLGHLGMSDSIGSANNTVTRPLRALLYRDDANDVADGSNAAANPGHADPASGTFVQPSAQSIVDGTYVIYQNQTYVTVRRPDATYANNDAATEAIKGDNTGNDVRDLRQNVLGSVATFPFPTSAATAADALIANSFILPQFMAVRKDEDGLGKSVANPNYNATLSNDFLAQSATAVRFNPAAPGAVTTGNSSTYGNVTPAGGQGAIPINANNYLFGDFDQRATSAGVSGRGYRDFSDLDVARRAQSALHDSGLGTDMFAGGAGSNTSAVAGVPAEMGFAATKGDLIAVGDFDANGRFDGEDLRRMARGTALADSTGSTVLTGNFADKVRTGVLRKNAALDALHAGTNAASAQQKIDARAIVRNADGTVAADLDPTGANAFNRFDVNRDGRVGRTDARIVDYFVGKDYRNLDDQLGAVVRTDNGSGGAGSGADLAGYAFANGVQALDPAAPANASIPRKPISLVDVELNDNGAITHIAAGGDSDARQMVYHLQGRDADSSRTGGEVDALNRLLNGDANFDGGVNGSDFALLAGNFGRNGLKWSGGDFNFDGDVNGSDFALLAGNFGKSLPGGAAAVTTDVEMAQFLAFGESIGVPVPEPTASAGLLAAGMLALRRRRRA